MSQLLRQLRASGAVDEHGLESAMRRQQIYGGSLDTVLLELELLEPAELAEQLSAANGCETVPVVVLEPGPERPWDVLPDRLLDLGWAMPLRRHLGRVQIAIHPEIPAAQRREVEQAVAHAELLVTCEACLAKLAAQRRASVMPQRYAILALRWIQALTQPSAEADAPEQRAAQSGSSPAAPWTVTPDPSQTAPYSIPPPTQVPVAAAPTPSPAASPTANPALPKAGAKPSKTRSPTFLYGLPVDDDDELEPLPSEADDVVVAGGSAPAAAPKPGPKPAPAPPSSKQPAAASPAKPTVPPAPPAVGPSGVPPTSTTEATAGGPSPRASVALAERLAGPRSALAEARERDQTTDALARAAMVLSPRVALFGVRQDGLRGVASPGEIPDVEDQLVEFSGRIEAAVDGREALERVTDLDLRIAVGQEVAVPCLFVPVRVHERAVLMLYVDRDGAPFTSEELAAARELCELAGHTLEQVLQRMRERGAPAPRSGPVPTASPPVTAARPGPAATGLTGGPTVVPTVRAPASVSPPPAIGGGVEGRASPAATARLRPPVAPPPAVAPTGAPPQVPTNAGSTASESDKPPIRLRRVKTPSKPEPRAPAAPAVARQAAPAATTSTTSSATSSSATSSATTSSASSPASPPAQGSPEPAHAEAIPSPEEVSDAVAGAGVRALSSPLGGPGQSGSLRGRIELDEEDRAGNSGAGLPTETSREIDSAIRAAMRGGSTAIDHLRNLGEPALRRVAKQFPGELDIQRRDLDTLPPLPAHGPLIRVALELGPALGAYLVELVEHPNPTVRFYVAFVFMELRHEGAVATLGELAFDPDADVRAIAMRVLETYSGEPGFAESVAVIRRELDSPNRTRQLHSTRGVGTVRDIQAVPKLIDLLASKERYIQEAALESLCSITGQQLGLKPHRWRSWYGDNAHRHRVEWIISSLAHKDLSVRRWAADELRRITGQRINFLAAGNKQEREIGIRKWAAWWSDRGRAEFGV